MLQKISGRLKYFTQNKTAPESTFFTSFLFPSPFQTDAKGGQPKTHGTKKTRSP